MINMGHYKEIIRLRNGGETQEEIAQELGLSCKTVGRYLRRGEVPIYVRNRSTKTDPFIGHEEATKELLETKQDLDMRSLFERLRERGYVGSYRTLCRKTAMLRQSMKGNAVYFERQKVPGRVMEGDFTELGGIEIGGQKLSVHLWVVVLTYSNKIFATPFLQETFECFARGSQEAFEEFGGLAEIYRLDNLSPVVIKVLRGGRETTKRFKMFHQHYGFKVHFCNPARGWEKGSVESVNGHLKKKIETEIALGKMSFVSLDSFREFVQSICRKVNEAEEVASSFKLENLRPLPPSVFEAYETKIAKVSKYSTVIVGDEGHRYSVPSKYVGCNVEVRIYPAEVMFLFQGQEIAKHGRIIGKKRLVSIQLEHVILELCKKPGVVWEWKYNNILFEHPVWNSFYERMKTERNEQSCIKEFLKCLSLTVTYGRHNVTAGMQILEEQSGLLTCNKLEAILTNEMFDPMEIKPVERNLVEYDELLRRKAR